MSNVFYHASNDSIKVFINGEMTIIPKGDGRFHEVLKCIQENRLQDIPDALDVAKSFKRMGLELIDGVIHLEGEPLPKGLSNKVMAIREMGLPTEPLFNFWDKLKENPSLNSRKMLFKFLEHNGHPITEDGCFLAYRGVTEDFKDRHTNSFDNSVGSVLEMPRENVDDNPNNLCSAGLHVASYDYAYGFGPKRILVKIDPSDVVCVPEDYQGTKMRVCKFEVIAEAPTIRQEPIYTDENSDDYWEDHDEDFDWNEWGMPWE